MVRPGCSSPKRDRGDYAGVRDRRCQCRCVLRTIQVIRTQQLLVSRHLPIVLHANSHHSISADIRLIFLRKRWTGWKIPHGCVISLSLAWIGVVCVDNRAFTNGLPQHRVFQISHVVTVNCRENLIRHAHSIFVVRAGQAQVVCGLLTSEFFRIEQRIPDKSDESIRERRSFFLRARLVA